MIVDVLLCRLASVIYVATVLSVVSAADSAEGDVDSSYDDYDYDVADRRSSSSSLSRQSSASASVAEADSAELGRWRPAGRHGDTALSSWRWCYVCSGKSPDRQCELFPQRVTVGPAKVNCTKNFCTAYVRYKPKEYLVERDRNGKPVVGEALTPDDYEVTSVARECADVERGNECHVDVDGLGATCYSSCTTHYCNDHTRRPTWRDLRRRRRADRRPSADDAPSHTSYSIDNDDTAESRTMPGRGGVKGITMYQPAHWNEVVGGGSSYDLSNNVNDSAAQLINSVSGRMLNSDAANSTVTSSAACRSSSCINGFTAVVAVTLITYALFYRPTCAVEPPPH